ncbi:MAG: hypothetical protein IIA41_04485, partial [SAR324 cluster bacterium]|nr:hypothetical protein [SAR324 cluster bacterium]
MFLQKILHDKIVGLRLLAILFIAAGLALSGCEESDDSSSSGGSLSFTDGDGIAETTDAPSFSPSTVTAGSDVTVTVSVDSDT